MALPNTAMTPKLTHSIAIDLAVAKPDPRYLRDGGPHGDRGRDIDAGKLEGDEKEDDREEVEEEFHEPDILASGRRGP